MRDNHGTELMPVWKVMTTSGIVIISAWNRCNALYALNNRCNYYGDDDIDKDSFSRVKNCFCKTTTEKIIAA